MIQVNVKELEEQREALLSEGEQIVAKAESASREPTAEEHRRLVALYGKDGNGGELAEVEAKLLEAREHSAALGAIAARRAHERGLFKDDPTASGGTLASYKDPRFRDGTAVKALSNKEKFADFFAATRPSEKPSADCDFPVGELIKLRVNGPSKSTPHSILAQQTGLDNSLGGFAVPDGYYNQIIDLQRAAMVVFRAGAMSVPMDSATLMMGTVESDPTVGIFGEGSTITASDITFGQKKLEPHKAAIRCVATREWWADCFNAPGIVENVLVQKGAVQMDQWILDGSGSGEPLGLLNNPDISSTAVSSASAPVWQDIGAAAIEIRKRNFEPNAVIMSPANWGYFQHLMTGDGTNSAANWLGFPPTLDGQIFFSTSNMPEDKILVGDFSKLMVGIRQGAALEVSTTAGDAFETHRVQVKLTYRFDSLPTHSGAFEVLDGISL